MDEKDRVLAHFTIYPDTSFLKDNIPTLGFYGSFEPAVQPYSCRGSVFWMGKVFLGLMIPEDHLFWTAAENEGEWQYSLKKGNVYNHYQDSSHILITDYPNIGASEIRAWCKVKAIGASEPFRASENYNRLSYNSAFPWQADSTEGVVAMNYIFQNKKSEWEPLRLYDFKRFQQGVYYRDAVLETDSTIRLNLADIPLPDGILRVDRIAAGETAVFRLGHYALPDLGKGVRERRRKIKGKQAVIIDNGEYQLAMVALEGWENIVVCHTENVHPVSKKSTVLNVEGRAGREAKVFATLLLWKRSGEEWKEEELLPVKTLRLDAAAGQANIWLQAEGKKAGSGLKVEW